MARKPRVPSLEILTVARIEQTQIELAALHRTVAELAEAVEQLAAQVDELAARPTYPAPPAGAPTPSPGPPRRRLLAGRWPLRDGTGYPRIPRPPHTTPYDPWAIRYPPIVG